VKFEADGFVAGFAGEQYAGPDGGSGLLREVAPPAAYRPVRVAVGPRIRSICLASLPRVPGSPSLTGNRLLYRDGLPMATFAAGEVDLSRDARSQRAVAGQECHSAPAMSPRHWWKGIHSGPTSRISRPAPPV